MVPWIVRGGLRLEPDASGPVIMGILNLTPDSFFDGGVYLDPEAAVQRALEMIAHGADIIDIGAESTRPGARPITPAEELARLTPFLRAAAGRNIPFSIDTRRAEVARAALDAGALVVNDVSALGDPAMPALVAESGAGLVLMHMRGEPPDMQDDPHYGNVVREVESFLLERLRAADASGISMERIALDPGIGFGKRFEDNIELLGNLDVLARHGRPVVVGLSRKSFLGPLGAGETPAERLSGSIGAAIAAFENGAAVVRTHDPRDTRRAFVAHANCRKRVPHGGSKTGEPAGRRRKGRRSGGWSSEVAF